DFDPAQADRARARLAAEVPPHSFDVADRKLARWTVVQVGDLHARDPTSPPIAATEATSDREAGRGVSSPPAVSPLSSARSHCGQFASARPADADCAANDRLVEPAHRLPRALPRTLRKAVHDPPTGPVPVRGAVRPGRDQGPLPGSPGHAA